MPYRKVLFIPGEIYHVFNRSVARQPIFVTEHDYARALDVMAFYSYASPPIRYSHYIHLPVVQREAFLANLAANHDKLVEILCFCLMPNHVHLLVREISSNGISQFMKNFQNSYARYFNVKTDRTGALFQAMFKAVRIETDEQLIHVGRYIHLNPLTAYVVRDFENLDKYKWSSYSTYMGKLKSEMIDSSKILSYFSSIDKFIEFTKDQVTYQRELDQIKHLLLE